MMTVFGAILISPILRFDLDIIFYTPSSEKSRLSFNSSTMSSHVILSMSTFSKVSKMSKIFNSLGVAISFVSSVDSDSRKGIH